MKFDKHIPIPEKPKNYGKRGQPKWELDKMEIGESFSIATENPASLNIIIWRTKKKTGFDYTRKYENGNLRVWRIS